MTRSSPRATWLAITLIAAVSACQQAAAPRTDEPVAPTTAGQPTTAASVAPTAEPEPTRLSPTTDVPDGYRKGATVPFGLNLAVGDVLVTGNMDDGTVTRRDATTFEELGRHELAKAGDFPPNVQSVFAGASGVWITLAFDHAVALMDPATGKITRTIEVLGQPYDVAEADGQLWIADFGWGQVSRHDVETGEELAIVRGIPSPTDVIVGEGAVWAPVHTGRAAADEPITAGGFMAKIDPATNEILAKTKLGPRPYYVAAGFGGVWTGTATGGSVDRVDAATGEVTTILIGEDGAFDIEVVGDSVWAVVGPQWPVERQCDPKSSYFVRIDPATRQMRELVAFPCPNWITPAENGFWVSGFDAKGAVSTFFEALD